LVKVLHVVESFASGVASAVIEYVANSPQCDHYLLYAGRKDAPLDTTKLDLFAGAEAMAKGHIARAVQLRRMQRALNIDIVHGHSTYGGVYARSARFDKRTKILYTPHCFAFERTDIPALARAAILIVEKALSIRTTTVAGCSRREVELAQRLRRGMAAFYLPSVVPDYNVQSGPESSALSLVGAGRMSFQKDIPFFLEIVQQFRDSGSAATFTWIGGGTEQEEAALIDAGVEVTGWLNGSQVLDRLSASTVYLHTARWEGFPLGVLDAIAAGVPSVIRRTPSTSQFPEEALESDVHGFVQRITELTDPIARQELGNSLQAFTVENSRRGQSEALRKLYAVA